MAAVVMVTGKRVGGLSYALQPLEWPEFNMVEETRGPETMHPLCWVCPPPTPLSIDCDSLSRRDFSHPLLGKYSCDFWLSQRVTENMGHVFKKKKRFPKAQNPAAEGRKTLWLASRNERFEVEML